jgi:hypothetical protein
MDCAKAGQISIPVVISGIAARISLAFIKTLPFVLEERTQEILYDPAGAGFDVCPDGHAGA